MSNLNLPVQGNSQILVTQLDLRYRQGFDTAVPWYKTLAGEIGWSRGQTVVMPWNEPAKRFEKFTGEFKLDPWVVDAIQAYSEPWRSNIEVDRYAYIENIYMQVGDQAASLGRQAAKLPDDMLALALRTSGASQTTPFVWYDGQPVFSEVHPNDPRNPVPGQSWANLFKGKPLTTQNIIDVWEAMADGVVLPNGRRINAYCNKIGVSPRYGMQIKKLLENERIIDTLQSTVVPGGAFGATANVLKGALSPVIMDTLSDNIQGTAGEPDVWYMWDDTKVMPATVYWIMKAKVTPMFNDNDAYLRAKNKYLYLGEGHAVAVITAPWFIARVEPNPGP